MLKARVLSCMAPKNDKMCIAQDEKKALQPRGLGCKPHLDASLHGDAGVFTLIYPHVLAQERQQIMKLARGCMPDAFARHSDEGRNPVKYAVRSTQNLR
jgi:hypothetical protein